MSALESIIGVDVGDVLGAAIPAAVEFFTNNTSLQIAQLNLEAQRAQANAAAASTDANTANTRLLITGGFIIGAAVLAIRALRK